MPLYVVTNPPDAEKLTLNTKDPAADVIHRYHPAEAKVVSKRDQCN